MKLSEKISGNFLLALGMTATTLFAAAGIGCATEKQPEPVVTDKFAVMDTNNDGKVVLEEFRTAMPGMNEKAFVVIDKNGDNGIDRAEWLEFVDNHASGSMRAPREGAPMNNIPGDPLIPPPDSNDLPLMRPPVN